MPTGIGNNIGRDGFKSYNNEKSDIQGQHPDLYESTAGKLGRARKSETESQGLTEIGGGTKKKKQLPPAFVPE